MKFITALFITIVIAAIIDVAVYDFMDTRCLVNMFMYNAFGTEMFDTGNWCTARGYY